MISIEEIDYEFINVKYRFHSINENLHPAGQKSINTSLTVSVCHKKPVLCMADMVLWIVTMTILKLCLFKKIQNILIDT